MAHYTGPTCKLCRQLGEKLVLKGEKCDTKCVLSKRTKKTYRKAPRKKQSEYGKRFRESQKLKYLTALGEAQMRNYYRQAVKMSGAPGKNLLLLLEERLDNIVRRIGFSPNIKLARQIILHGHVVVNNRRLRTPGYRIRLGDKIALKEKIREFPAVKRCFDNFTQVPSWVKMDKEKYSGEIIAPLTYQDISYGVNESLIVELYSR